MFQAVHTDRSGRVYVSADYGAAAFDGVAAVEFGPAIPLPAGAQLMPLPERAAIGLDRGGRPRSIGAARWTLAAVLPRGHVRLRLPACAPAEGAPPLEPLPYAAVAADERGELVVAATGATATPAPPADVGPAITARLRADPTNRVLRQLARCAREYGCPGARDVFLGRGDGAIPVGAPATDGAEPVVALRRDEERAPLVPVTFKATAADAAAVATAHLAGGGARVTFGQACEGEPLAQPRTVRDAVGRIRAATRAGEVALRTSGSSAAALARLGDAGLDRAVVRFASADPVTYGRVHRPRGFAWSDVRATLRDAATRRLALTIELLVLPGLTDRAREADALLAVLGELPAGTGLRLTELCADPYALLARLPQDRDRIGMPALLERLATDAAHLRRAA